MNRRSFLPLVVMTITVSGCVSHQMYRDDSVVEEPGYTLAFIEFDDRGEIWSPRQFTSLQNRIRVANQHEKGAVVVLLAHGWNNDASPKNEAKGTLAGFKSTLDRVAVRARVESPDRPVIGVYLGWRGKSMKSPFSFLTFFSRQRAAARVAGPQGMAVVSRIILDVKANPESSLILIGHSFGGQIFERMVQQGVAAGVFEIPEGPAGAAPDLTVLLNPASPATNAKQVIDLLRWGRFELERRAEDGRTIRIPLLVSLTSEGDRATRVAYRIGSLVGLATSKFRTYGSEFCSPVLSQRSLYAHTAGNMPELHSHEVSVRERSGEPSSVEPSDEYFVIAGRDVDIEVERRPGAYNDTPYWIMQVPTEVMADHNDTWNPNLVALISGMLETTGALDPESELYVVRDDKLDPVFILPWTFDSLWIVDRSRRVLDITEDRDRGILVGCVPEGIDLANIIGHTGDAGSFLIVQWRKDPRGHDRYTTEIDEVVLGEDGFERTYQTEVDSDVRFLLAAADRQREKIYLVTADQLFSVDYKDQRPSPELLAELSLTGTPSAMDLDGSRGLLYLLDEDAGNVLEFDLGAVDREIRLVTGGLGAGSSLAVDPNRGDLVVVDPAGQKLLRFPRSDEGLGDPDIDPLPAALHEATYVHVSENGSLWVGDLVNAVAFHFSDDGELLRILD